MIEVLWLWLDTGNLLWEVVTSEKWSHMDMHMDMEIENMPDAGIKICKKMM